MPIGESVMPVVEVGAVPRHAELVEPGGAEFGFKTFAEIAFGLGIEVDASSGIHIFVGSFSFMSSGFGRRTSRGGGVAAKIGFRAGAVRCRLGWWSLSMQMSFFPMRLRPALKVAPIKLMNALRRDGAVFFVGKQCGDFLPRPAPLALFTDEIHEWFKPAVKSPTAAAAFALRRPAIVDDVWIHQRKV